jgi:hypothetical protein
MAETKNQETPAAANFSLADLENTIKIIDVAASRGAFRGEELSSVGSNRDKLVAFLTAARPPAEEGAAPIGVEGEAPADVVESKKPARARKA